MMKASKRRRDDALHSRDSPKAGDVAITAETDPDHALAATQRLASPSRRRGCGRGRGHGQTRPVDDADAFAWPAHRLGQGLLEYTVAPEKFSRAQVVHVDSDYVVIRDMYPKSLLHLLILPRDRSLNRLHPLVYLAGPERVDAARKLLRQVRGFAVQELDRIQRRRYPDIYARLTAAGGAGGVGVGSGGNATNARSCGSGSGSGSSGGQVRELGLAREADFQCGIHANPSMGHVHLHLVSRDLLGECLRHKAHYNSFTTPFFVDVDKDAPLDKGDEDIWLLENRALHHAVPLKCRWCGAAMQNLPRLKEHLADEWRRRLEARATEMLDGERRTSKA